MHDYGPYGYNDPQMVLKNKDGKFKKTIGILAAIALIVSIWLVLDQKLLTGEQWLSATYDNDQWRTNEGSLPTYGAWDLEAHVWKTEFIMKYFPHFNWNPYWYMGMPLLEYYQPSFYAAHAGIIMLTGLSAPKAALLMIVFGHLLATLITFLLCYKISRKIWVAALCSLFLLSNTFITLRSYGWEPITVVFLFLYPLGLLFFLKEPLKPFRASIILTLAVSYLSHPLIFFSLFLTMATYLFYIALTAQKDSSSANTRYILSLGMAVLASLLLTAFQFIPQIAYEQVTSGAHMGVKYLPFYQVPYNIITPQDFLFDAGNLKGPGPIIMIALLLFVLFLITELRRKKYDEKTYVPSTLMTIRNHPLTGGLATILVLMIALYYMERFNIFPMNILRSIQYHRIIPEFVVAAAALVASLSNIALTRQQKAVYAGMLIAFVVSSGIIVYNVQEFWQTYDDISSRPEAINDKVEGRISFPYTDQSLSVRSSYNEIPQTYGYYEQGITNPYNDEMFSVSSGFHDVAFTTLYLKSANVARLYVNIDEGLRDQITMGKMNTTFSLVSIANNSRYAYFEIPIRDPSLSQAVDGEKAALVKQLEPGCRVMFKERYCGSAKEEFVGNDPEEVTYLSAYVDLLEEPYYSTSNITMVNPDHYVIGVTNATNRTAVVVKMTFDENFKADIDGKPAKIRPFGPYFMLIEPQKRGDYEIALKYGLSKARITGFVISGATAASLLLLALFRPNFRDKFKFAKGDMA